MRFDCACTRQRSSTGKGDNTTMPVFKAGAINISVIFPMVSQFMWIRAKIPNYRKKKNGLVCTFCSPAIVFQNRISIRSYTMS